MCAIELPEDVRVFGLFWAISDRFWAIFGRFWAISVAFGPFRSLLDQVGPVSDSSGAFCSDFGHSRAISETSLAGGRIIASEAQLSNLGYMRTQHAQTMASVAHVPGIDGNQSPACTHIPDRHMRGYIGT